MYTNIRGVKGKRSSLIEHIHSENPQIFLLTETLLTTDNDIHIDGYTFFGKARKDRKGGGVGILVQNEIKNSVIPHISDGTIEIIWLSARRKKDPTRPVFIGCYYGKQETRCSKEEILVEMNNLSEEIERFQMEGEVIIFMDGNGKIGLLGEEKSRNGKLLDEVFENHGLVVMNRSERCVGKITRQCTTNKEEKSAIDFVVTGDSMEKEILSMLIDEEGILKVKGQKDTDHNTIVVNLKMEKVNRPKPERKTKWRLNAPEANWKKFRQELGKLQTSTHQIFSSTDKSIDKKYSKWLKNIESAAWMSIGKTTIRNRKKEQFSENIKQLRREKGEKKNELKRNPDKNLAIIKELIEIQNKIKNQILTERTQKTNDQLKRMTQDKSRVFFWKERKRIKRNATNECLTIKNEDGRREYDPEKIMDVTASFYEKLYAKRDVRPHEHHKIVIDDIQNFGTDMSYDTEWYNEVPTEIEVKTIIENKKNNKASTDLKNELMKNSKDQFTKILMPLIKEVWLDEKIPKCWNKGSITSIWKGKGDKECLGNHRGITVSSAIGSIVEELIDKRVEKLINYSQGQAGGIKGAATADHLFLLRGMMTIAIKKRQNLFVTFFDVKKAYDQADVTNMLHIMWKSGVKGKIWRILKELSTNLTAEVKSRFGTSREITRYNGGKQGSRLMGRQFSKQMDTLSEDFIDKNKESVKICDNFSIGCLAWVDDILSCTIGIQNQNAVLDIVDDFACKNKLEWGEEKCQVMQIGKKVVAPNTWKLGEKEIKNTTNYKYLGDTVTNDNKNKRNLEIRENRIQGTIRQINTTASSDIMRGVETQVLLTLYEKSIVAGLLHNSESWTLNMMEEQQIDKIGIRALKRLFNLPTTTPTVAILYNFGILYMTQSMDQKRFMYLHKILNRESDHWTKKMLTQLKTLELGWAKNMTEKLIEYQLEQDWENIRRKTKAEWKKIVDEAIEENNRKKLIKNCTTKTPEGIKVNTKTKTIHENLTSPFYKRQTLKEIVKGTKQRTKTILLARHGMLECGKNFKGTIPDICRHCNINDDENHRLNECILLKVATQPQRCNFTDIFSNDETTLTEIIKHLESVWEFRYANGRTKKD